MSAYNFSVCSINGQENYLSHFDGNVTLIVNIASRG